MSTGSYVWKKGGAGREVIRHTLINNCSLMNNRIIIFPGLSYINKGLDKHIINPDIKLKNVQPVLDIPSQGWNLLEKSNITMSFTHGHIIAYFVDRKASDNLPASDIKSISDQA